MAGLFDFLGSALSGGGGFQPSDMAAFGSPLPAIGGMSGATRTAPQDSISAFLGSLGGDQPLSMGGDTPALPTQAPGDNRGFFARLTDPHSGLRHGIGDFLGNLGDALLTASGNEPMYAPRQQKKQLGGLMANFLGADTPLGKLALSDPESAAALYKIQQENQPHSASLPSGVQEFLYDQSLPPDQRSSFRQFLQILNPGMGAPITIGANDTVVGGDTGAPGAPSGPPQAAVDYLKANPGLASAFDEKYGAGSAAQVLGGGAGNGTGGF